MTATLIGLATMGLGIYELSSLDAARGHGSAMFMWAFFTIGFGAWMVTV